MINQERVLAIIPARGGSKGLPRKNLAEFCGKPLIAWSILSALNSKLIDDVVVSTDDLQIANIAMNFGASVPFIRPSELASDDSKTIDVVKHALEFLEKLGKTFEYIVLVEPTSPIRATNDLDAMITKLQDKALEFDGLVSIGEVKHHPNLLKIIDGNTLKRFSDLLPNTTRRQDDSKVYFPFGVGYVVKVNALKKENTFYTNRCTYFKLQPLQCVEIDDANDLRIAEMFMKEFMQ